jgi:hypothetical protein
MSKLIRSTKFWLDGKGLILRPSRSGDEAAIARLVELEEAPGLVGDTLVAELDGTIVAALSVHRDQAVADIFRPTAAIVRMLRHWRAELTQAAPGSVRRPRAMRRLLAVRRAELAA